MNDRPPFSPSSNAGVMNSVMLFCIGYVGLTIIAAVYVVCVQGSLIVTFAAFFFYSHVIANWLALFQHSNKV